jgi:regulatory protein
LDKSILLRLSKFCASRERCNFDVYNKALSIGVPKSEISIYLKTLTKEGFIDEERFVKAFINDAIKFNKWGPRKIEMALLAKKIPASLLIYLNEKMEKGEFEPLIHTLANAKWNTLSIQTEKVKREKTIKYLISKGFPLPLAKKTTQNIIQENPN